MALSVETGVLASPTSGAVLDWSVAQASKTSDGSNGDGFLIRQDGDHVMVALVDGVGSGYLANEAANVCLGAVSKASFRDFHAAFEACHRDLTGTRGAALALSLFDLSKYRVIWAAVGDIDGFVLRPGTPKTVASIVQRAGTLGHSYLGIYPNSIDLQAGDLVSLCSDGVSRRYRDQALPVHDASLFARDCLERFGRKNDDRTCAAIRWSMRAA